MTEYMYYMVQKEGGDLARVRHHSYESARAEADRLARKIGGRYTILLAVGEVVNTGVYHNRYMPLHHFSDEVPF